MIDYISHSRILYDDNLLNIDSERLFREAEDNFLYFNKSNLAVKNLKKAIEYSPCNVKCIKFLGDIYYAEGKIKKAFDCYAQAAAIKPQDAGILASLASINEILGNDEIALEFTELAFKNLKQEDVRLFSPLSNLKVLLLMKLQKYSDAQNFIDSTKKRLPYEDAGNFALIGQHDVLKKKLALREKMERLNIKVV